MIGLGLATTVIVARALGPAGRGVYAVAGAVTAVCVQLGNLGLHASNTWAVARRPDILGTLVANSIVVGALLGGALAGGVFLLAVAYPALVGLPGPVLWLCLLAVPVTLVFVLLQNLLLGIQRIKLYNGAELVSRVVLVGVLGGSIAVGAMSVSAAVAAGVISVFAASVLAGAVLVRASPGPITPRLKVFTEHASYGLRAYAAALFSFLVLRADLLLVHFFRGAVEAGYYSIAVAFADLTLLLPVVVGSMLFPRLSRIADPRERKSLAKTVAIVVAGLMAIGIAAAALLSEPIVALLFGVEFLPAVPAFLWLLPGILCISVYVILANFYAASGFPRVAVIAPLVGFVANVGLDLLLIPQLHLVGASIASTLAYGVVLAVGLAAFPTSGPPVQVAAHDSPPDYP